MKGPKEYSIFTDQGTGHSVVAASLIVAVREFDQEQHGRIVAACDKSCMPSPQADRPFVAVFLSSPHFASPEGAR